MAVIFGKAGTTRVSRGAKLICTPEQLIASPSLPPVQFEPGDFDFNDGVADYTTNTVTFTKSGRLYIVRSFGEGEISAHCYINSVQKGFFNFQEAALLNPNSNLAAGDGSFAPYGIFDININDTMYFIHTAGAAPIADSVTVSFYLTTFNGTLISQYTATKDGCYLTTATVQFKGLDDKGPELTAMRLLREHFRGDSYYDSLIIEYYQNSPTIINGINSSIDSASEYEYIYQSVLRVKSLVDGEQWEQAKDEYLSTYFTLKNKYITDNQ